MEEYYVVVKSFDTKYITGGAVTLYPGQFVQEAEYYRDKEQYGEYGWEVPEDHTIFQTVGIPTIIIILTSLTGQLLEKVTEDHPKRKDLILALSPPPRY